MNGIEVRTNGIEVRTNGIEVRTNGVVVRTNGIGFNSQPEALELHFSQLVLVVS